MGPEPLDRAALADRIDADLRVRVLPYWRRTAVDRVLGGYRLDDVHLMLRGGMQGLRSRIKRAILPAESTLATRSREWHLVSQARLMYVFSLAHRLGYGDGESGYLQAAEHGFRFLTSRMRDERHGGFVWRVGGHGEVRSADKWLYGQSFALYALVEFHRASRRPDALADALALFHLVQERMVDRRHGGWIELLNPDFSAIEDGRPTSESGIYHVAGLKSANGHLHWMEALTELLDVTGDLVVREALTEALRINMEVFFAKPGVSPSHVTADWRPVDSERFANIYYGHDVEFAWLMLRAQRLLDAPPDTSLFAALVSHSLDHGFDAVRGGFFLRRRRGAPDGLDTSKVWWAQAEGLAALTDALVTPHSGDHARYERCLRLLVDWIWRHQRLRDGVWVWSTDANGRIINPTKADPWKAGYHEVRAMTKAVATLRAGSVVS